MVGVKNERIALDHRVWTAGRWSRARTLSTIVPPPARDPVARLSEALEILAARMHEAVAERRGVPPGSERYRRADERVAYLNELYLRLQRRVDVPAEIWLLDSARAPVGGRWSHRRRPR
jgi:hypothetical protein